jgi:glycosyltransferase involved in cell wall biosynthesis
MTTLLSINNYHYYRGGADTIFLEQNRMFEALGWTVVPFAMQHPDNLPSPWSSHFVEEIEFGAQYGFAQRLRRLPKIIYSLEARRRLDTLLTQTRPNVAHGHNIYHHISPSILGLLKKRCIPTLLTLHDLKIACPAYKMLAHDGICERCRGGHLYNVVTNRCIKGSTALSLAVLMEAVLHKLLGSYTRCVDLFVVPSRFYLEKLCEWGFPRSQFRHIPNFVAVRQYVPQYSPGRAFLYFGRVSNEKGLPTLIRAAARARCPLKIAGTGPELETMQRLAAELGADVTFLGYLTGEPLHAAIREARAVVLPSEWYENAPVSLLEAYALGKPVIGARIGGIPELIRENETGVCFTSGDEQSLATALTDMATRPDAELAQLGRCGRVWVEQEFTADMYRKRLLCAYRDVGVTIGDPLSDHPDDELADPLTDQPDRSHGRGAIEHPTNA